jgi:SAM-dependent methyltransferase
MQPEEYRKMAAVEDEMWYYRALHRHVVGVLERAVRPGAAVLDAGCGTGGLLKRMRAADHGWRLAGLDLSPLACELARERTGAVVVEGSVTELPFGADSFEAITSCDVLCQIEHAADALDEFYRCLRPGGVAVVNVPAFMWLWSYHDEAVQSKRRFDRAELTALFRAAGFQVGWSSYWNMLPFPLTVVRRKLFPPSASGSDVRLYPAAVEAIFNTMMMFEHDWMGAAGPLPLGSSVLAVGVKPARA